MLIKSEKQEMFEKIRHLVAVKHQVPQHLTLNMLEIIFKILADEKDRNEQN